MRLITVLFVFCAAAEAQRLTLEEAVATALKANPRISAEAIGVLAAEQTTLQARSAYFPTIVANTTGAAALDESRLAAGALNNPIIFNRYAFGAAASQLITDFGRTSNIVESTRLRARSQRESVQATRAQIVLIVHRAYLAALRAQGVRKVAQQTIDSRQVLLDQVTELARSRLRSMLDVSFAEVNVSEAKLSLVAAQNDYDSSIAELSAAMGYQGPQQFELVDVNPLETPPPQAGELMAEALRTRPEVTALRLERDAASRIARAEAKLVLPTISALANAGLAPAHDERLRGRFAAAGVNLSLPIFNGRLFEARKAEADLRVQAIEQRLKELENVIAREVTVAVLNAKTAFERIELTAQLVKQASLALELAEERYKLGLSSIVELSQAQLNKTAAEIRNTSAKYDYLTLNSVISFQAGRLR